MKTKLLFIFTLCFAINYTSAQVYVFDAFDYGEVGTSLLDGTNENPITKTAWDDRQGGDDDLLIEADPGWALDQGFDLNPTGNAIHFQGGGEDAALRFASAIEGAGTSVYLSFLLDVKGWDATAGHNPSDYRFIHFGVEKDGKNYNAGAGLYIGPGSASQTFKLGLANADKPPTWFGTEYSYTDLGGGEGTTVHSNQFFIVIKATFGGDGTAPDHWMWVNPAISTTVPTADVAHTAVEKIRTSYTAINIEASSNARTPDAYVDEIRVTGTWDEALGLPAPVASVSDNALSQALSVYPNPTRGSLEVATNGVSLKSVKLMDLTGKVVYSSATNNTIDTSRMAKGLYLLKVTSEDGLTASKKIVVQ